MVITLDAGPDNAVVILLLVILLSGYYLSKHLSNAIDIPDEYWYRIPQQSGHACISRKKKAESRNISIAWKEKNLDVVVFWGSQSGRAETLAKSLASALERFGLQALVVDLEAYDHKHLAELQRDQLCIFFLSTYGDGDPPDNTNGLWCTVNSFSQGPTSLQNLRYCIFGLGNTKYRLPFNVSKTIDHCFRQAGAVRLGCLGRGDDANGTTEDDFLAWKERILHELSTVLPFKEPKGDYQPAFTIQRVRPNSSRVLHSGEPHSSLLPQEPIPRIVANAGIPKAMQIAHSRRLWETADRLCLHLDISLPVDRSIKYKTGDHVALWSMNRDDEVKRLIAALGMEGQRDVHIDIDPANDGGCTFLHSPTTLDALLRYYLEIAGALSRDTVAALTNFAPSESARQTMVRMSADPVSFRREILERKMTLADLLEIVAKDTIWPIPMSFLLERTKTMQPRFYSISSSALTLPGIVSVTAVIDKRPDEAQSGCYGMATGYLRAIDESMASASSPGSMHTHSLDGPRGLLSGHKIFAHVRQSTFKLPFKASSPIIMIGCGTGAAPFRAFVRERVHLQKLGHEVGRMVLFLGFRNPNEDFIYQEEWLESQAQLGDDVLELNVAFSREHPERKSYVQDLLAEKARDVMQLLDQFGTRMYVCGSASMARDVSTTLTKMRASTTGDNGEAANSWLRELRRSKKLLEDVWS